MHPTIPLRVPGPMREYADIDIGIAPLIQTLWRLGFTTWSCCQGGSHKGHLAFIQFEDWDDAERLLMVVGVRFGWELEPEIHIVRFPPTDIPFIAPLTSHGAGLL